MRLNAGVTRIDHLNGRYQVMLSDGDRVTVDGLILATPANVAARLLKDIAPTAAAHLAQITHNHIGTISLAYPIEALSDVWPVRGLMIPRREGRRIDAMVFTSAKIPNRAPAGYGLIRVFFGGGDPSTAIIPEGELVQVVTAELQALLGLAAQPIDYRLVRWENSYPQAEVGHLDLVNKVDLSLPDNVFVTGASYRGLAVPDCVNQGRATARVAMARLLNQDERQFST